MMVLPLFYTFRPGNAEPLKQCVAEAFADAEYPGDGNISISACGCGECTDTRAFFGGNHWRDLAASGQSLPTHWAGLSILSPEAWRFYLPAYLMVGLSGGDNPQEAVGSEVDAAEYTRNYQGDAATDAMDSALWAISPHNKDLGKDYYQERYFGFSAPQMECLAAYAATASQSQPEDENCKAAADYWALRAAEAKTQQGAA